MGRGFPILPIYSKIQFVYFSFFLYFFLDRITSLFSNILLINFIYHKKIVELVKIMRNIICY